AIAVKVRNPDNLPFKSKNPDIGFRNNRRTVHKPDIHLTCLRVPPKNVLFAVAVEISGVTNFGKGWDKQGPMGRLHPGDKRGYQPGAQIHLAENFITIAR